MFEGNVVFVGNRKHPPHTFYYDILCHFNTLKNGFWIFIYKKRTELKGRKKVYLDENVFFKAIILK